jgi:hypothetical protein
MASEAGGKSGQAQQQQQQQQGQPVRGVRDDRAGLPEASFPRLQREGSHARKSLQKQLKGCPV